MRHGDNESRGRERRERQRHEAEYRRRVEAQRQRRQSDYEEERTEIWPDEVIGLLRSMEDHRNALTADAATLQSWLETFNDLHETWSEFQRMGGIGADDFDQFLSDGKLQRRRLVRQRRHLRLVSSQQVPRRRLRLRTSGRECL
jgi:hypothetical protein